MRWLIVYGVGFNGCVDGLRLQHTPTHTLYIYIYLHPHTYTSTYPHIHTPTYPELLRRALDDALALRVELPALRLLGALLGDGHALDALLVRGALWECGEWGAVPGLCGREEMMRNDTYI